MGLKLSYKDVIEYFDEASTDMAELVLSMVEDRLHNKIERKMKISANLKKARAARGNKAEVVTGNSANVATPHRGRPKNADPNDHNQGQSVSANG